MERLTDEIAATAARLVAEQGLEYGPAKRHALRQLGLPARTPLPGNDALEAALRDHIALFCASTQPVELAALRRTALIWMQRLAAFRPHLGGAVWHGTATRFSDIHLQLFCDDPKSLEIELINQHLDYEARATTGLNGQPAEVLGLHVHCEGLQDMVGLHLLLSDASALRGALKPDAQGRKPRGTTQDVQALVDAAGFCQKTA